ncbi:ZIP metal ion transporter-like protein [Amylocarpus encephaloides]|uniref:ZIP metal ion transporter-like protein n=1 Tax=Amylocarpus encephaloides TaxID=45428 RepID=A0A9P8C882_9HELO|nr:ZIP metal ion transporter-like protein [Amylocarpus encephaloides]
MLDGLFFLIVLSVVMALASFLAGAIPLSMGLSSSKLRAVSTIGMGVLVGTSLIVIIPEGVEAVYSSGLAGHSHTTRGLRIEDRSARAEWPVRAGLAPIVARENIKAREDAGSFDGLLGKLMGRELVKEEDTTSTLATSPAVETPTAPPVSNHNDEKLIENEKPEAHDDDAEPPTFWVGISLILGFVLMFLIDKLPRHASETLQPPPPTRHIALNNLSGLSGNYRSEEDVDEESESFLQSMAPTPKQTRSLATTIGLVIHSAADGIAMGASTSTPNSGLGFIVFIAIMIHKMPAAFGLTSVLLKQGLSKRAARGHLIMFSLAAPFGALSTWLLVSLVGGSHIEGESGQWWTGMLLLFSGGTFLYVAMHAMQEDSSHNDHPINNGYSDGESPQRSKSKPQMRDTGLAVFGMLVPLLTQVFGHHH